MAALEITDANDYYPFGMNHLKTGNAYFAQGNYKAYKYNGKELQETGMYSYGWSDYMPDIGRWNGVDQLAEKYLSTGTYTYVANTLFPMQMLTTGGLITMAVSIHQELRMVLLGPDHIRSLIWDSIQDKAEVAQIILHLGRLRHIAILWMH